MTIGLLWDFNWAFRPVAQQDNPAEDDDHDEGILREYELLSGRGLDFLSLGISQS